MMPPGVVDQPTSAREGFSQRWAATLREVVMMTEGREPDPDQVTPHVESVTLVVASLAGLASNVTSWEPP